MIISPKSNLSKAINTTKAHILSLESMGLKTVEDLLYYFPRDYEVHQPASSISEFRLDQTNIIEGQILDYQSSRTKNNKQIYKAFLMDKKGYEFEAVWFHKPFQLTAIRNGERRKFIGKVKYEFNKFTIISPQIEKLSDTQFSKLIYPIYAATEKISSSYLQAKIESIIHLRNKLSDSIPYDVLKSENLVSIEEAIKEAHLPSSLEKLQEAKKRLAFEELFNIQIAALKSKHEYQKNNLVKNIQISFEPKDITEFFQTLEFTPTNAQKIAIYEILKDMDKPYPMSRLLEGDVGSGKTLVAATVAMICVKAKKQVAILAPTEVLAAQHLEKFRKLLPALRINILLGSQKASEKKMIQDQVKNHDIDIIVGTHALLSEKLEFNNLGLVVIDEQHRFGVKQRELLKEKYSPHLLSMTATPIPRTLALVAYGDQDLSVLNEMPAGRKDIITRVVKEKERNKIDIFIDDQIEKGRQVYVICPLISDSKSPLMEEVKSVKAEREIIQDKFPNRTIAILHGKMSSKEKEDTMQYFRENKINILISTSVIEVGVDVPNASIMLIEGAERFGLSQLHQFRGRVGRSDLQSYCFLCHTKDNQTERLRAMEKYLDGFSLAEIDLKLRGPGEVYGIRQSGVPDLKMASYSDHKFVIYVKEKAEKYFKTKVS